MGWALIVAGVLTVMFSEKIVFPPSWNFFSDRRPSSASAASCITREVIA
jgi:hypothetical protein